MIPSADSTPTLLKLDIGSGPNPIPGFKGVDPYCDTDYRAEMWDLPFANDSVDEIFSSHALEHIPQKMVLPTLAEWRRVIKPDRIITIRVPDLEWCVTNWLKNKSLGWELATIFGNQERDGEFHKTGFTTPIMIHYLMQSGLKLKRHEILFTHQQQTLSFEVSKS